MSKISAPSKISRMSQISAAQIAGYGILAGMAAGAAMAMYAMVASAWMGQGFFTPLYGIASPLIGAKEMETSMMRGLHLAVGPALLGALIHMIWSGMYGAAFGLVWTQTGRTGPAALGAGVAYGLAITVVMALVVLPIVGAGAMPGMIGFSFVIEHVLFGLALGMWPSLQPGLFAPAAALRPRLV